ncbi:MAG: AAA family ATPase [Desulfovibrio sp.]|nr:AAA family ATPase [Desulfovibrio sp.]
MSAVNVYLGGDCFRRFREEDRLYVDKTPLIEELLTPDRPLVSVITRPRRFGKTLAMSMLEEFFSRQKQSASYFEGLAVAKNSELCSAWMNKYPVLSLSLKEIKDLDFARALANFSHSLSELCYANAFLLQSDSLDHDLQAKISLLKSGSAEKHDLIYSLRLLSQALHSYYGLPTIILIDAYDVPLHYAKVNGYYPEMVDFLGNMFSAAFKTNDSLEFAVLTGCLRIAKESIFTGLNNFVCYGLDDKKFSDAFGFTDEEVEEILKKANLLEKKKIIKEWYDGYIFGRDKDIYCPWDINYYVYEALQEAKAEPKLYWINTSSNSIVTHFLEKSDVDLREKFEKLLNGGSVETRLVETTHYDLSKSSEEEIFSLLYATGYLTRARHEQKAGKSADQAELVLPNKEIREVFLKEVKDWLLASLQNMDRTALFAAFWRGDALAWSRLVSSLLLKSISYYGYHEDYYHAFLAGLFAGTGVRVRKNIESGEGRADILLRDPEHGRAACLEVKLAESSERLHGRAEEALAQIAAKRYAAELREEYPTILSWGVSFWKKSCFACVRSINEA